MINSFSDNDNSEKSGFMIFNLKKRFSDSYEAIFFSKKMFLFSVSHNLG